jgi:hypothetical protein
MNMNMQNGQGNAAWAWARYGPRLSLDWHGQMTNLFSKVFAEELTKVV